MTHVLPDAPFAGAVTAIAPSSLTQCAADKEKTEMPKTEYRAPSAAGLPQAAGRRSTGPPPSLRRARTSEPASLRADLFFSQSVSCLFLGSNLPHCITAAAPRTDVTHPAVRHLKLVCGEDTRSYRRAAIPRSWSASGPPPSPREPSLLPPPAVRWMRRATQRRDRRKLRRQRQDGREWGDSGGTDGSGGDTKK
jgi:hypothetical protein